MPLPPNFPKGSQTTTYDGLGRVIATLTSDGATYETTYDDHGRIASLISPQRTLEFHYQGRYLSAVTGGAEDITIAQRDAMGRVLLMHYGERLTIEQTYHANGQLASLTQTPKGGLWKQFEYDEQGGLIGIYRQNQPDLTYTLNAWGAPETMHYEGNDTTLLDGDRHTLNLPAGAVLTLDDEGRRKTLQRPGLADVETERDGMGRPTATLVGSEVQATYTYTDNLLSQVGIRDEEYPDANTLTYNDNAQLTQISNNLDGSIQFGYEVSGPAVGKVKTHTDPNNTSYQYSYDARGRVTGLSISNGPSFSYAYDAGDNLTMVESGGLSTSWSGYGAGLPAQMQWSSMAQPLAITKNQQGRLTGVSGGGFNLGLDWSGGDNVHISGVVRDTATQTETWAPAYDATNRRLMEVAITRNVNEVAQNIIEIYGSDNQLKTGLVRRINGATVLNQAQSLDIDADRRRVSTMYSTNSAASTAEYDDVGNLIRLEYGNGASQHFSYDGERRVREILTTGDGDTRIETYRYDHQKRRIETIRSGSNISTVYAWQGSRVIAVGEKENGVVVWTYAIGHGPLGPTFIKDLGNSGNDYHIMTDHLGTPYAYRHAGTGTVYHTPYNPWGEPMHIPAGVEPPYRSSGELPADNGTPPPAEVFESVPLGLGGHFYDIGTGLVYMHNRYYHPRLGHFLTPDFRAPDIYDPSTFTEPYAYAAGNPVMFWDPDGLDVLTSFRQVEEWKGWFGEENLLIEFVGGSSLAEEYRVGFRNEAAASNALEKTWAMAKTKTTWDGVGWLWHGIYSKDVRSFAELFPHEPYTERLDTYVSGIGQVPSYTGDFKSPLQVMWYAPEGNEILKPSFSDSEIRSWIRGAAEYHDVPLMLLAVILQQENAPEVSGFRQTLQFGERSVTTFLAILDDAAFDLVPDKLFGRNFAGGSSGFANMSRATLRDAANYTEQYYLKNPLSDSARYRLLGWDQDTRVSGDDWKADLYYAAGHLRQLIDRITNTPRYRGELTPAQIEKIFAAYNGFYEAADKYGADAMGRIKKAIAGETPLYFYQRR